MKKLLIATTALTLSAGFAAAEVKIGGFGFAGVANYGGPTTWVETGIRLEFTGTATTSAGTSFEAYVRSQYWTYCGIGGSCGSEVVFDRQRITVKHDNLTVALGSTHGAMNTLAHVELGGGYNDWWIAYLSNSTSAQWDDGANALVRYDSGAFSIAVSSDLTGNNQELAVQYSANGLTFGAGISTLSNWMLKAGYTMGDLSLTAGTNSDSDILAGVNYTMGDFDFGLFGAAFGGGGSSFGLDVGYSLGGGVRLSATATKYGDDRVGLGAGVMFNF